MTKQTAIKFNMDTVEGDQEAFAANVTSSLASLYNTLKKNPPSHPVFDPYPHALTASLYQVSLLKHFAVGACLYQSFETLRNTGKVPSGKPIEIHHRPKESFYVVNSDDKVIIAHSMKFIDDDERVIAELILKGFNYDHKLDKKGSAPGVLFTDNVPAELASQGVVTKDGATDWCTLTYFQNHVATPAKMQTAVSQAQNFRTFVASHTKSAKTYMSNKMRTRIEYFEKVAVQPLRDTLNPIRVRVRVSLYLIPSICT